MKAAGGTFQSSGFSKLSELSSVSEGISKGYIALSDFINRHPKADKADTVKEVLPAVANVMADELKKLGKGRIRSLKKDIVLGLI